MNYIELLDNYLIWALVLTIPLLWFKNYKTTAIQTFISSGTAWFTALTIKKLFPTPRPYVINQIPALINNPPSDSAFPSAHTALAFTIATSIFLLNKKWGIITYIIAIAVGILRTLALVHYPIDILGGAILGSTLAIIIYKLPQTQKTRNTQRIS